MRYNGGMATDDLEAQLQALTKRGFKLDDPLRHDCPDCGEHAVAIFRITGTTGGRDINVCLACGKAHSWRSGAGFGNRAEDKGFDLRTFLKS